MNYIDIIYDPISAYVQSLFSLSSLRTNLACPRICLGRPWLCICCLYYSLHSVMELWPLLQVSGV